MTTEAQSIGRELLKTGLLGAVTLETLGRVEAALRWLERMKGRQLLPVVE
ncbi:MAG: hypothetical protein ABSC32_20880 [Steroidobacteraceae bacterium]|jgi:hypothetical protein